MAIVFTKGYLNGITTKRVVPLMLDYANIKLSGVENLVAYNHFENSFL